MLQMKVIVMLSLLGITVSEVLSKDLVALMPVEKARGLKYDLREAAESALVELFKKSGKFDIMEKSARDNVLRSQMIDPSTLFDDSPGIAKAGKYLGVHFVCLAKITEAKITDTRTKINVKSMSYNRTVANYTFEDSPRSRGQIIGSVGIAIRLVDIETGEIVYSDEKTKTYGEGLLGPFDDHGKKLGGAIEGIISKHLGKKMLETVAIEAIILELLDQKKKRVRLNVGKDDGVRKKMKFFILERNEGENLEKGKMLASTKSLGYLEVKNITGPNSCEAEIKKLQENITSLLSVTLVEKTDANKNRWN